MKTVHMFPFNVFPEVNICKLAKIYLEIIGITSCLFHSVACELL